MVATDPNHVAAAVGKVLGPAAKPFLQRALFALTKRGLLRDRDAAGRLTQIPGPHTGLFAPLGTVTLLPPRVTYAHLIEVIRLPAFRVYAQQLIAAQIVGSSLTAESRIRQGLLDLFVKKISAEIKNTTDIDIKGTLYSDFRPAFDLLWGALYASCAGVARQLTDFPITSGASFSWAQSTLSLAAIESIEHYRDLASSFSYNVEANNMRWLDDYRKTFVRVHGTIPLPDLGARRRVAYEDLYIEPLITAHEVMGDYLSLEKVVDLIDRTVMLGDPGAGKSTTSNLIAMRWSEMMGPAYLLPLRLLDLDESGFELVTEIERILARRYQRRPPTDLVERTLYDGTALLIFDGLDEILSAPIRDAAVAAIEAASVSFPLSKILVTSRRVGYSAVRLEPQLFIEMNIRPFHRRQAEKYAKAWFSLAGSSSEGFDLDTTVANFMKTTESIPDLRENPLMLSYICVLYRGYNDIPRRRSQFYRRCVELLLHDWDMSRGIAVHGWEVDIYEIALIEIAYLILTNAEYRNGMTESQLRDVAAKNLLAEVVPDRAEAERLARGVVDHCRGRGWIFTDVGLSDSGEATFAFTHRSLLEYFAAQHIVRNNSSLSELASQIIPLVLSGRGEILAQVCVNLIGQQKAAGGSSVIFELLARMPDPLTNDGFTMLRFVVNALDSTPINRRAMSAVISRFLMIDDDHNEELSSILFSQSFRHASSIYSVLRDVLIKMNSEAPAELDRLVKDRAWLWDFCLVHQIMGLERLYNLMEGSLTPTFTRLFSASLSHMTRRPPIASAYAIIGLAFNKDEVRSVRLRAIKDLDIFRSIIGDAYNLNGVIPTEIDIPPWCLPWLEGAHESFERSIRLAAGYRSEIVSAVVFIALALCETIAVMLPVKNQPRTGTIAELLECRKSRGSKHLPGGIDVLSSDDRNFVNEWCSGRVSLFLWEPRYRDYGG